MPEQEEKKGPEEALRRIEDAKRSGAQDLELGRLDLTEIPEPINQLPNLRSLNLGYNKISSIPELLQLPNLQRLQLAGNKITIVPDSIIMLPQLEYLGLTTNQVTYVSENLAELANLKELALGGNRLRKFPESVLRVRQLRVLYIWSNGISGIPDSFSEHSQLRTIQLGRNAITAIPDSLMRLSDLQNLNLSSNRITVIPDSLERLSHLEDLNLSGNQITAIPDSLARLSHLQQLALSDNQISAIPNSLARLSYLQHLDLSSNQITAIPDSLAQLSHLQHLDLSSNEITAIPDSLARLSQIVQLSLANNWISIVPDSLSQLSDLNLLDVRNNQISTVSEQLAGLPRLQTLLLHGNPKLCIPEEILGTETKPKPAKEILAYLATMGDSRPLNEAKLILVGQGAVGKTSLVKKLTTGKFKKGEKTTEGIKISDWDCPLGKKNKAKVHIWDFGGQELMHATHQFFLTQRSLYVLVLNRRTGGVDREADYWFRLIRAFGGKDAPVIVVLNKQESEPFDVNREGWLKKYSGNLKGFVATDCEDAKTITQLKRKIVAELESMESLKARFPRRWFAIKDELSTMAKEHISFEEYQKLCRERGEEDPASQKALAGFLHDLGIALNYSQDPKLRFNYVLKPEWVTQGIYALLHAFVAQKGVFTHAQAETALEKKKYSAEETHFILGLMERFELSFSLGDKQDRVLIPELLADAQAKEVESFKPEECLNFGYKYSVLPEGLLPRFIARTHYWSKAETRWKSGVILEDPATKCRGLIQADPADAEVRVHIDGSQSGRSELLGTIRFNFETIHSDYESKPVPQVYSPAAPKEPLSLPKLEALARSRTTTVPVVLPDDTVIEQDIAALVEPLGTVPTPVKLFLSYSHLEEKFINELRKDLKVMEMNGLIHPWYDRALTAGEQWEPAILESLKAADIVVCQISRDYLFSDNCRKELNTAIRRNLVGEAALAAYILTESGWKEIDGLSKSQILPTDGKPLADWPDPNKYWRAVIEGIQKTIKKLQTERRYMSRAERN